MNKKLKVLILGKGYIGNSLSNLLKIKDVEIYHTSKAEIDYFNIDILDSHISYLNKNHIDFIINCVGFTGKPNVEQCEYHKEMCWKYNVNLPILLTSIAKKYNIPVIHIGSGCIYSSQEQAFSEKDTPNFGLFNQNSSFYSKTKHAFELSLSSIDSYIFRIRMPFSYISNSRNLINKILLYDNLISYKNSLTNIEDLNNFIYKFISLENKPEYGIYNVTNTDYITAKEIVEILKKYGLENPRWKFLKEEEMGFKSQRSNCFLSTEKIKNLNLELPNVRISLEKSIKEFKENYTNNI